MSGREAQKAKFWNRGLPEIYAQAEVNRHERLLMQFGSQETYRVVMAARTRVHACFLSKSAEKENMGSFWSSSATEPVENLQSSLKRNEHGRKVQTNLQTAKSLKQAGVQNADASKINTIRTPQHPGSLGRNSARKVKSAPGWSFRCTTKTYKLPAGTPRPQFPSRGGAGHSNVPIGRGMISKRRVVIANQSSEADVGAGKDTEIVGVFRKGTPHPKRKRVSICSNVFRAGGDIGESNSSPAEISNISTCSTQTESSPNVEDKIETSARATTSRILDFSPDLPRPSSRHGVLEDSHIQSEPESEVDVISDEKSITKSVIEGNEYECDFVSPEVSDLAVSSSGTEAKESSREDVCSLKQVAEKRKRKFRSASPGRNTPKRQCRVLRELKAAATTTTTTSATPPAPLPAPSPSPAPRRPAPQHK